MKILSVHNRYVFGGGEDGVRKAESALLRAHEHTVEEYSEDNRRIRDMNKVSVALSTVWSRKTYRAVRRILSNQFFDVIPCSQLLSSYLPCRLLRGPQGRCRHHPILTQLPAGLSQWDPFAKWPYL